MRMVDDGEGVERDIGGERCWLGLAGNKLASAEHLFKKTF